MELKPEWEYVADRVMGGVSTGQVSHEQVQGRAATRLTGAVSLENNGGFIQMTFDLDEGKVLDASAWRGVELEVLGNGARYDLRLRTDQLDRPWQSFRADFAAPGDWTTQRITFADFHPNNTEEVLDPARLRRIGILAVGQEMDADVAVSSIRFYR